MKTLSMNKRLFIVIVLCLLGVVIGTLALHSTKDIHPNLPKNQNGQTYGSAADVTTETEPDLIKAIGSNGTVGYVLKKDLYGEQPKTPKEALAMQNSRPSGGRDIPLYDIDGKTKVGVFHVEG